MIFPRQYPSFVLSGFVLTYNYQGKNITLRTFYLARFARVWPATACSILLVLLFLPRNIYLPSSDFVIPPGFLLFLSFLGLQAWIPIPSVFFSFNAVVWSISVELFFYFCYPFFKRIESSHLCFILIVNLLLCISFALFTPVLGLINFSSASLNIPVWEGFAYINPLFRLPEFLLGIFACNFFLSMRYQSIVGCYNPKCIKISTQFAGLMAILSFISFLYLGFKGLNLPFDPSISRVFNTWPQCFCFSLVLVASCQGPLVQLLSCPILVFFGELSFGVYLYHQPLILRAAQADGLLFAGIQILPASFLPLMLVTLLVSAASFYFVERPVSHIIKNKKFS